MPPPATLEGHVPTLGPKQHHLISTEACKQLDHAWNQDSWSIRKLRECFLETTANLDMLLATGLSDTTQEHVQHLIQVLRHANASTKHLQQLDFNIYSFLQTLQCELKKSPLMASLESERLYVFLQVTKRGWQRCREQGYRPELFIPREQFWLGVIIRTCQRLPVREERLRS